VCSCVLRLYMCVCSFLACGLCAPVCAYVCVCVCVCVCVFTQINIGKQCNTRGIINGQGYNQKAVYSYKLQLIVKCQFFSTIDFKVPVFLHNVPQQT